MLLDALSGFQAAADCQMQSCYTTNCELGFCKLIMLDITQPKFAVPMRHNTAFSVFRLHIWHKRQQKRLFCECNHRCKAMVKRIGFNLFLKVCIAMVLKLRAVANCYSGGSEILSPTVDMLR